MPINPTVLNLDKDKLAALEIALGRIEKDHGKGSVMRGNEQVAHLITNAIPTGSLSLDLALGVGGLPRGPRHRNLRQRIRRQIHPRHPYYDRNPAYGRPGRLC